MSRRGFTLLEVVVAVAVLGVFLTGVALANARVVSGHVYVKKVTVASLLARGKMIDLEQKLHDEGFSADDDEDSGDFSDEGWPQFKWRARILAPKTQGLTPQQVMGAVFSLPMGEGAEGMGPLAALFGGNAAGKQAGGQSAPGADPAAALAALGPVAGMAQAEFTRMVDEISKTVREVHLTVSWKEGRLTESFDLVTHVVSLGKGSDRNGGAAAVAAVAANPGAEVPAVVAQGGPWVRQDTGALVANPVPAPNGQMVDPVDNMPLVPQSQWYALQGQRQGMNLAVPPGQTRGLFGQPLQLLPDRKPRFRAPEEMQ